MSVNLCPQCKTPNRVSARFCSECGEPLISGLPPVSEGKPSASKGKPSVFDTGSSRPDEEPTLSTSKPDLQSSEQVEVILASRYRLESELGRGGFGAVYKAWDANISRPCAVKENLDSSTEAARQFAREASVLANLSHPHLPRVTDHFSIPGKGQYLVMDFVDGEDLASILERKAAVPVPQAVEWVVQVAEALEYLHEQEPPVVHRDIKPANIRITLKNQAMLVDFGLVKLYSPGSQTTMGARAVTPGYAPPEQYGKGKTDARTDIYALGATLYHILTGAEPLESVQRISGQDMSTAAKINPHIPLALSQTVERALALDPGRRFQSAGEFRQALIASLEAPAGYVQPEQVAAAAYRPAPPGQPVSKPLPAGAQGRPPSAPAGASARPASQPAVRPPSHPAARPASQPRPASRKRWLPITTIVVIIVLCMIGALVLGGLALSSGPSRAEITATVRMQQTLSAGIQATTTRIYEIKATQTAAAQPAP